ncbi:hypothetical protein AX15_002924 [Amanita polypyramis BW_CC]|nr:hypothetical protein AX15_002924 [Amanita polypyramis BW_CC]
MPTTVQRTYAGRHHVLSRKRPLSDENATVPLSKRTRVVGSAGRQVKPKDKQSEKQQTLIQLHFCTDRPILKTCPLCSLSYTKGAPDDEMLHTAHCAKVQRGMEWGREEEKECTKSAVVEIATAVKLKDGSKGRIICFRADTSGRVGSKVTTLLETINLTLSAPPLTAEAMHKSKLYLFLVPHQTKFGISREKIVGCAVAQHIETAMAMATPNESQQPGCQSPSRSSTCKSTPYNEKEVAELVIVDTSMGIFCHPELLPTPMGIPRLFVAPTHRRQGIASKLLTAAARTFVYGYELDPRKGEVAFTQPTGDGKAVMLKWGGGGIRIYED